MLLHEAIGTPLKDPGNYPAMITTMRAHVPLDYLNQWALKLYISNIMFDIIIIFATTQDRMYTQGQQ